VSTVKTFRDLIAWQRAKELAKLIYRWTFHMPNDERFGLTMQMRRASISIPSNIAEGYARESLADYLRFLRTARGSLAELMTQTEIAVELEMIQPDQRILELLEETDRVLQGLIRSLSRTP
jgi:four helix bundle protein